MRFKTQLGLHPAWTRSIHIPAALLLHFRALGLDNNTLVYVLQIVAAYWRGEEANHGQIAQIMGVSERSLRNYNASLQESGLITINGRYMHGNRLENDYDLTPLLDSALMLDATNQQQQQSAEKNAYKLVQSLVNAMEAGDDVSGLLADLARQWRETTLTDYEPTGSQLPVETGNQLPVETGNPLPVETGNPLPVETGNQLPVSIGNQLPVSIGSQLPPPTPLSQPEASFRLKPEAGFLTNDDDDQCINVPIVNESSSMITPTSENPIKALMSLKGKTRFDRQGASVVAYKALKHFGEDDYAWVIEAWCDFAKSNKSLTNAPGFVRVKLESGEWPPEPAPAPGEAYLQTIPAHLEGIIKR